MEIEQEIKQEKFSSPYQKAIINVIFTANHIQRVNNALMKENGLTIQQYNILRILRGQLPNAASIQLLTDRMLDKTSNASRLVEKLRVKEYLERSICNEDRRSVNVIITEKGLELLNTLDPKIENLQNSLKTIPENEINQFNSTLNKLRNYLK